MPKAKPAPDSSDALSFENAMEELDAIVHVLEDSQLPLDELVERYERGTLLLKTCQEKLADAQQRIEIIARGPAGKPDLQPFDAANPPQDPSAPKSARPSAPLSAPDSSDDEIRLF